MSIHKLIAFILFFISFSAFAGEIVTEYKDPASMGRGDTTTSWSDSSVVSTFYNPSFLSDKQDFSIELINPVIDLSKNSIGVIQHPPSLQNGNLSNTVSPFYGNTYAGQAFASPEITYKGFTLIPVFATGGGQVSVNNPVFPSANGLYYYDWGTSLAKGIQIDDHLSIGASAILYHRHAALGQVSLINVLQSPIEYQESGTALSANLGANYKLKDQYDTTFAADFRNIGSPSFWNTPTGVTGENEVSNLYQEIDLGVSSRFFPVPYFDQKMKWAFELHNLSDSRYQVADKISAGLQYNPVSWFNLKCGIYEASPTAGIGLETRYFSVDVSTYSENNTDNGQEQHVMLGLRIGYNL